MMSEWLKTSALQALTFYLRRSRWERGRWRLTQYAVPWTIRMAPRLGRRVVKTRHGFRMDLDLRDLICQVVWATGEFEQHTSHLMQVLLTPGATVVDVGANIGYFALLAARLVGPTGRVHAFEPVPSTCAELVRNLELNHLKGVTVHEEALWDCAGEATIFIGPDSQKGISAMRPFEESAAQLTIRTTRFDDCMPPIRDVGLVKIDVEGAEHRVLNGMRRCLERDRPDLIVEVCDAYLKAMGTSAAALCDLLTGLGYRMYGMDYDGLVPMPSWLPSAPHLFNALFTHRVHLPRGLQIKPRWHDADRKQGAGQLA